MSADAGIVAPVPMGAWDSTTAYEKMNIVSHNGYVYMAYQDNTGHEPVSGASDTYWMLLVSGGVVSVDSAMSTTSTNPVQNKVISEALATAKAEAQEVVTDQYDATVNYGLVGNANGYPSYCIKDDVLYKCIVACVGVAPPNVTYWEATSVGDELSSVNSDLGNYISIQNNSGFHNAIYRGKYLGSSLTSTQSTVIRAGTFDDLFVGDYWTIGGVNYRIADFDYFLRSGDTECTTHHIVVVPDTALYNAQMNTSNVTTGGYVGSAMYTTNLATAKSTIETAFGSSHILAHREYLCNAVSSGRPSGGAWLDSSIELMSEAMVYGAPYLEPTSDGSTVPAIYSVACKQLNLFRHRPDLISNRTTYWLRNVVSAAYFAHVNDNGNSASYGASLFFGVRPAFAIY